MKDNLVKFVEDMESQVDMMDTWVGRMNHEMERVDVSDDDAMSLDSSPPDYAPDSSTDSEQTVALTTSLLKLPAELIVMTLGLAAERDRTIPLVLSHSNSFFRKLVIAAPSLWRHIDIMDGRLMTEVRLARSGSTPLHVHIAPLPTIAIDEGCRRINEFSQIVAPHISRVRSLDIESVHPHWVAAAIPLIESGDWGMLDFLGVKVANPVPGLYTNAPSCDVSRVVCKARRVHLQGVTGQLSSPAIVSNVVRELHLTEMSVDLALCVLAATPFLEHLVLKHLWYASSPPQTPNEQMGPSSMVHQIVRLEALRTAELISYPAGWSSGFIRAPNLETLVVGDEALGGRTLLRFLEPIEQLRNLDINDFCDFPLEYWEDILRAVPFLTRLRLCETMACTKHLNALIAKPGDEGDTNGLLCPNLEELVLENEHEVGSGVVRRVVSSRLAPDGRHSTIRSLIMRGWDRDYLFEDDVEEIRRRVEHFVLETWDTRHIVRVTDDDGFLSPDSDVDTESEDWELASGDVAVVQGLQLTYNLQPRPHIRYDPMKSTGLPKDMQDQCEELMSDVVHMKHLLSMVISHAQEWLRNAGKIPTECGRWICKRDNWCTCYDGERLQISNMKDNLVGFVEDLEREVDIMDTWVGRMKDEAERLNPSEDGSMSEDSCPPIDVPDSTESSTTESKQPIEPMPGLLNLPPELIVTILEFATERDWAIPVLFSHSNSFLRQLVLGAPSLWTYIDIVDGRSKTEVHLTRSGSAPLHVRIAPLPTIAIDEGCRRINGFLQILAPHASRVRSLDIDSVHPQWVAAAMPLIESGNWDPLDFLGVRVTNNVPSAYIGAPHCDVSRVVCNARRLHLQGVTGRVSSSTIFSDVVRELHLTDVPVELALGALGATPSLEHLVLRYLRSTPPLEPNPIALSQPIHLAALRSAEVFRALAGLLLPSIDAPNLETFVFGKDGPIGGILLQFLERTKRLQSFEIRSWDIQTEYWRDILRALPCLTRLRLCGTMACTQHLSVLVAELGDGRDTDGPLCPNLEELVLDNEYELGSDVIRRLVSSRLATNGIHSTIYSVVMRGWAYDHLREDDVEEIRCRVVHFVLETWDTRCIVRDVEDGGSGFLSLGSDVDTESEDWELASGDEAVVQGLVRAFP
ncbi:hypothetical protein FRB99_005576 [Tulasnella sp. 403]|nr:hypothetical protein FRB99_005576 [Tulasnella sp. 403]